MRKSVTVETSPMAKMAKVRRPAGKTYVVKKAPYDGKKTEYKGKTIDRPVSIRNLAHWVLGNLEEGTLFHALYRDKKQQWLWGYAVKGTGDPLTYSDFGHCGWVMVKHLQRRRDLKFERPPLKYYTWDRRVFASIAALYLNRGEGQIPNPVPTEKRHDRIKGYYNCGPKGSTVGCGGEIDVDFEVAVRYRNVDGWYMARRRHPCKDPTKDPGWFFIHRSQLHGPKLKDGAKDIARRLNSHEAERRAARKNLRAYKLGHS